MTSEKRKRHSRASQTPPPSSQPPAQFLCCRLRLRRQAVPQRPRPFRHLWSPSSYCQPRGQTAKPRDEQKTGVRSPQSLSSISFPLLKASLAGLILVLNELFFFMLKKKIHHPHSQLDGDTPQSAVGPFSSRGPDPGPAHSGARYRDLTC